MNFDWTIILFGASGIGILKLLWDIVQFFIKRKDNKHNIEKVFKKQQRIIEALFSDLIVGAVAIQEYLEEFVTDNNVASILLLKMQNGGGIPQLSTEQHISILNEAIGADVKDTVLPIKQDFQNYSIDANYQRMMIKVIDEKVLISDTVDLDDNIAKIIYEAHGITNCIILPITHVPELGTGITKGFLIYLSIQFVDNRKVDPKLEAEYIILAEKIRQIFHEFYIKRISIFKKN